MPNSLPRVYDDKEHKQWLKILNAMMASRAFNHEMKLGSSAARFMTELAERIEEYEKFRWPVEPPTKAEARAFRRDQERKVQRPIEPGPKKRRK